MVKKKKIQMDMLNDLYENNLINYELYETIKGRYEIGGEKKKSNLSNNLVGLGILFIALSMITIFAINWTSLGMLVRAFLSFVPLLITVVITWFTVFENDDKKKKLKKNILSIFAPIAIIASNALIDQTFQIQTSAEEIILNSLWTFIPIFLYTFNVPGLIVFLFGTFYGVVEDMSVLILPVSIAINVYEYLRNKNSQKTYFMTVINLFLLWYSLAQNGILEEAGVVFAIGMFLEFLLTIYKERGKRLYNLFLWFFEVAFLFFCFVTEENDYSNVSMWISVVMYVALFIYNKSYKNVRNISLLLIMFGMFILNAMLSNVIFLAISGMYLYKGNELANNKTSVRGLTLATLWGLSKLFTSDISFEGKSMLFLCFGVGFIIVAKLLNKKESAVVVNEEDK